MKWKIQKQDKEQARALAEAAGVSPLVAWLLLNRKITDPEEARRFLTPTLEQLRPETWMADMKLAVERIVRAATKGETVGIHGDYDVDGIAGAALLIRFFRALGLRVVWHIPHRQKEGYGMKPAGVERLFEAGASLLITVDCGVNDHEAIQRAHELGMEVIVLDHHQLPGELPPALAVINPHRPECSFLGEELSGAGVAFYLAAAVRAHLRENGRLAAESGPNLLRYLELVALGTIADMVPLTGRNRLLVHFGLLQLNQSSEPGIIQLRRAAGLLKYPVGVGHVAFALAPRLNAPGRLESGELSLALLLSEREAEAGRMADELERLNHIRQRVEERIFEEARRQIEAHPGGEETAALVAAGRDWHAGVIGIAAARLVELYHRPTAVISLREGIGKGSLRSVPGVNIYQALCECAPFLLQFGGHASAAGITVAEEALPEFTAAFEEAVARQLPEGKREPVLWVDAEWPLSRCDLALCRQLARLEPHGLGNPEPKFCARGVKVVWAREARNNTLLLGLEEEEKVMTAVGFGMAELKPEVGSRLDVVYTPELDTFEDRERVRVILRDFTVW